MFTNAARYAIDDLGRKLGLARGYPAGRHKGTGIPLHVLAQGTEQALQTAARDDADLVLVHDPEAEEEVIATGDGIDRQQIAWNDFILVRPSPFRRRGGLRGGRRRSASASAPN